jgi:hypothetical protein
MPIPTQLQNIGRQYRILNGGLGNSTQSGLTDISTRTGNFRGSYRSGMDYHPYGPSRRLLLGSRGRLDAQGFTLHRG